MLSALVTRSLTTLHSNMILHSNNYDDDGFNPINVAGRIGVSIGKRF